MTATSFNTLIRVEAYEAEAKAGLPEPRHPGVSIPSFGSKPTKQDDLTLLLAEQGTGFNTLIRVEAYEA